MQNWAEWTQQNKLSLEDIKSVKDKDDFVWVNVNRIYSKYSEMIRNNFLDGCQILFDIINNIDNEKEMYTLMKINDVVTCFDSQTNMYPDNTFLRKDA